MPSIFILLSNFVRFEISTHSTLLTKRQESFDTSRFVIPLSPPASRHFVLLFYRWKLPTFNLFPLLTSALCVVDNSQDGCPQVRRRASEEEAVGCHRLPPPSSLLGSTLKPNNHQLSLVDGGARSRLPRPPRVSDGFEKILCVRFSQQRMEKKFFTDNEIHHAHQD